MYVSSRTNEVKLVDSRTYQYVVNQKWMTLDIIIDQLQNLTVELQGQSQTW